MRTIVVILVAVLILGLGFFAYNHFGVTAGSGGGADGHTQRTAPTPGELKPDNTVNNIGSGQRAWVNIYDEKTGELVSRFRTSEYVPQENGTVEVVEPQAEFFLSGGQVLRISGKSGNVAVNDRPGSKTPMIKGQMGAPSRGRLQDVIISLFESATSPRPTLTAQMNNASFDNDTFRIYTDVYTDSAGNKIPGDQVPVVLRGDDYNFDGRGLTVRWNERDRRLQMMEIAHGDRLEIIDAGDLSKATVKPKQQSNATPIPNAPIDAHTQPPMLAEANGNALPASPALGAAVTAAGPIDNPSKNPAYRATFNENVRITQGDELTITLDTMHVDFLPAAEKTTTPAPSSTTIPTTAPTATNATPPLSADTQSTTQPVSTDTKTTPEVSDSVAATLLAPGSAARRRTGDDSSATTRPAQPVVITWTGKLQIAPLEPPTPSILKPGEAAVRMIGTPVVILRGDEKTGTDASRTECNLLTYETQTARLMLEGSGTTPLTLRDARGSTVTGESVEYLLPERLAIVRGKSKAEIPLEGESPDKPVALTATWSKSCTLHLAGESQESMTIERADFEGDVHILHPQLQLDSDALGLTFGPRVKGATIAPSTEKSNLPAVDLREVLATGNVNCVMIDAAGKRQSIAGDRLALTSDIGPDGKPYPKVLKADGNVRSSDGEQEMQAGHLVIDLAPKPVAKADADAPAAATQPANISSFSANSLAVERLVATDHVKIKTKDGTTTSVDELTVRMIDGLADVNLKGKPAEVNNNQSVLLGPEIRIGQKAQTADIVGSGSMHTTQQKSGDTTGRPFDVSWTDFLSMDGKANLVNIAGGVVATTEGTDGAINTASSQRIKMTLGDKPADSTKGTSVKANAATPQDDFFKDKTVREITLLEKVEVRSILSTPDGTLLRQMNLFGDTVRYDLEHSRMVVPGAGQIFYADLGPSMEKPADRTVNPMGDNKGMTAMKWTKSLVYDQVDRQAVMEGGVVVKYEPQSKSATPFRLDGDKITAIFAAAPEGKTPATPTVPGQGEAAPQLRRLLAEGNLHFVAKGLEFDAQSVEYDPATQVLTARGTERQPATIYNAQGLAGGTFVDLSWNARTQELHVNQPTGTGRRKQ